MNKVSVVTINFNNASGLRETIASVSDQVRMGADLEHVIVDGQSSDGFWEVVNSIDYENVVVVSEPDRGIYDAMNKGASLASGDSVIYLNSGDCFYPLFNLCKFQEEHDLSNEIVGCYTVQLSGRDAYIRPSVRKTRFGPRDLGHQGIFCPRGILLQSPFDLNYPVSSDSVWKHRVMSERAWKMAHCVSSVFALGGVSNSFSLSDSVKIIKQPGSIKLKAKLSLKALLGLFVRREVLYRIFYFNKYTRIKKEVYEFLLK
ncbi:glycosyltransferase [Thioalkalivibrio versutus]|uniref:glycosyltransferase n=1 Tax=Thioalkalivibrio versutus TaxID=106634 RepID=UPI000986D2E9|nr:glycosyltransferase [Thioalkalivibrio versutus]OOC47837.1 hypothetical protein B0684_12895 [Thioalkalivibrio versutus]